MLTMMSMRNLVFVAMLMGCGLDSTNDKTADQMPVVEQACGPRPLRNGYSVGFSNGVASMSQNDFEALNTWGNDMETWADCALTIN